MDAVLRRDERLRDHAQIFELAREAGSLRTFITAAIGEETTVDIVSGNCYPKFVSTADMSVVDQAGEVAYGQHDA